MQEILTLQQWKQSDRFKNLKETYDNYLLSEDWKNKKDILINIFWNKCECCDGTYKLQWHHGCYSKIWNEPLHHIFILCDNCHEEYHNNAPCISIQDTEIFITNKKWIKSYWKIRRKILRKNWIKVPKSNY